MRIKALTLKKMPGDFRVAWPFLESAICIFRYNRRLTENMQSQNLPETVFYTLLINHTFIRMLLSGLQQKRALEQDHTEMEV
jgi:hypothetical protein